MSGSGRIGRTPLATTAWLSAGTSPALPGVYQRSGPAGPYACWDGSRWRRGATSAASAALQTAPASAAGARWRGLRQAATAPCATCRGQTVIDHGFNDDSGADLIVECPDC